MFRAYTIASGKGGTGKTTVTVNLGTSLAQLGKETYILDADIGMANMGLILGLEGAPITLHEVLAGKAKIDDAIYEGPNGVKVVPSGISLQGFQNANPEMMRDVMRDLVGRCEFLLIDAPAGISKDGVVALAIADEVILVVNPELSSMADALKTKILTEMVGGRVYGAILNRSGMENTELRR
ncbi:MAG: septum site-determining protein MinD, partial [Methanobacteriota archaeon]